MDAINRDAAIKVTWENPSYSDPLNVLAEVRDKLKALPLVQPERPTGTWIFCEDMGNNNGRYCCSNCLHTDVHAKSVIVPYCWNCGAKIEGEIE